MRLVDGLRFFFKLENGDVLCLLNCFLFLVSRVRDVNLSTHGSQRTLVWLDNGNNYS